MKTFRQKVKEINKHLAWKNFKLKRKETQDIKDVQAINAELDTWYRMAVAGKKAKTVNKINRYKKINPSYKRK